MFGESEDTSHLILCRECGMAAFVPFEPREGREIFCRTCYRRRKEKERREGFTPTLDSQRNPNP
jgi:CxxC-x17-CxxC domain-containing protein